MSSHHFVKEHQEPALLLVDAIAKDEIDPLLEWSPTVAVMSHALDQVLAWGTKVDIVITEDNNVSVLSEMMADYGPTKILTPAEGSAIETALCFLISGNQSAVNIMIREPVPIIETLKSFTDRLNISLITTETRWSFIRSGNFKKWLPEGSRIQVLGAESISLLNLELAGNEFTVQHDGIAELVSVTGFWIGEGL